MKDTALVLGAPPEEVAKVDRILPDWELASLPVADGELVASKVPAAAKVIVAFAQEKEEDTMSLCEDLRSLPETSDVPILLVINRYQITQGNAVKRLDNADFVIAPINQNNMPDKIGELVGNS